MRLILVYRPQLVQQRLESRQEVADANLLAWTPDKRLLESQSLGAILLFLFLFQLLLLLFGHFSSSSRRRASPTARCHVAWLRVRSGVFQVLVHQSGSNLVCARAEAIGSAVRGGVPVRRGNGVLREGTWSLLSEQ